MQLFDGTSNIIKGEAVMTYPNGTEYEYNHVRTVTIEGISYANGLFAVL
jgi:hypothetical protein